MKKLLATLAIAGMMLAGTPLAMAADDDRQPADGSEAAGAAAGAAVATATGIGLSASAMAAIGAWAVGTVVLATTAANSDDAASGH